MKTCFYLAHPAHYHLFKNVIEDFYKRFGTVKVLIQKKDVLQTLTEKLNIPFDNILAEGRKDSIASSAFSVLKKDVRIYKAVRDYDPDIFISSAPEVAHVAKFMGKPSILVFEDDLDQVKLYSKIGPPFADSLLVPQTTRVGKFEHKTIRYQSYHELAYLHPNRFQPDKSKVKHLFKDNKPYFLIRFSKLKAYHDVGKSGITEKVANNVIQILKNRGNVYITSEKNLGTDFLKYQLSIPPDEIHHAMYYASLYIGDSQTMAAESAILGTPSIRFNDFVGKLSYLEDLEHKYNLAYGIPSNNVSLLYELTDKLSMNANTKEEWLAKRKKFLEEKIDFSSFLIWFISNYPKSIKVMSDTPDFQFNI